MPSTYSPSLQLELIGAGEQAGTWNTTTNTNLGTLLDQAIAGYTTQAVSTGTDTTLVMTPGASAIARNMYIELTGTGGANTNLIVPSSTKLYFIFNNTSSGQVTVKVSGGTGVSVSNANKTILVCNGTDIVLATSAAAPGVTSVSMTVPTFLTVAGSPVTSTGTLAVTLSGTALPVANGGTGASSLSGAGIPELSATNSFTATNTFPTVIASTACRINATAAVTVNGERLTILFDPNVDQGIVLKATTANSGNAMVFYNTSTPIGSIYQTTTNVAYLTSSDYRLKNSIAPMTGALAKVALLKPCTYKWNVDGADGQGFIAHELQEVAPYAVIGKKDGEQMQGVDYGRITPILTAALQETITKIEVLEARIAALEAK